uniref:Uncharacterized protein n=1 Tax=Tetranychus urticae TaxID=32264 RepID=T1KBI3_TETUR
MLGLLLLKSSASRNHVSVTKKGRSIIFENL